MPHSASVSDIRFNYVFGRTVFLSSTFYANNLTFPFFHARIHGKTSLISRFPSLSLVSLSLIGKYSKEAKLLLWTCLYPQPWENSMSPSCVSVFLSREPGPTFTWSCWCKQLSCLDSRWPKKASWGRWWQNEVQLIHPYAARWERGSVPCWEWCALWMNLVVVSSSEYQARPLPLVF